MTVHRRVTNDETADETDVSDTPTKTTSLEIGNTSSYDATMEGDDDDIDDLVDDLQRDVESLLSHPPKRQGCCRRPYKIGNCTVLCPSLYDRFSIGIVGPHWWGLIITFLLVFSGSFYFLHKAWKVGPITLTLTTILTLLCPLSLTFVGLADPGIISNTIPTTKSEDSKWCDICNIIQPSHAVHCPECNLCISNYDHHCPWMGTCVGKNNFRAFVVFNCSWIGYLIFGLSWVNTLAAQVHS